MSLPEVVYRVRERLWIRLHARGLGTAHRVGSPRCAVGSLPFVSARPEVVVARYASAADRLLEGKLRIFGTEYAYDGIPAWNTDPKTGRAAPLAFGKTIDHRDPVVVGNIKYLWEPNRHLHLVTLAQTYRLTQQPRYLEGLAAHLDAWFDQCPYPLGANWNSSLELAVRLVNWAVAWQLIDGFGSALFKQRRGQALRQRWLASIYQHMHFIRRYPSRHSSANNHLIGELAGLFVAAHTWPYWHETARWRQYAKRCLQREALSQNAPDGVNREQAVSYQQFVLDFLLLAALAGRANGDDFPVAYWQRIEKMLEFLAAIMDVRGNVPMIGDADDGRVVRLSQEPDFCPYRSLLATGAILFNRADFKFKAGVLDDKSRWLLGAVGESKFSELRARPPEPLRAFGEGGYYILGCDFDGAHEVRIVVDAGPLGYRRIAAHGHADALAFTLSIGGNEFLVDPGTYAYHTDPEWRAYFRGTRAHNTACVDGEDQSVQGGAFLWLRHARTRCTEWETGDDRDRFVGEHDGYRRLSDPALHRRELIFRKGARRLEVIDTIECRGRHRVERFWHFAEDVQVSVDANGAIHAAKGGYALRLRPSTAAGVRLYRGEHNPPAGWISRRFDEKTPTHTVVWENRADGTVRLGAVLDVVLPAESGQCDNAAVATSAQES